MASKKDLSLLQHPLTQDWLTYKWRAYARGIFLIFLAIRAFSIAMLVWLLSITSFIQGQKKNEGLHSLAVPLALKLFMTCIITLQVAAEINSFYRLRCENCSKMAFLRLLSLILIIITFVFALTCSGSDTCEEKMCVPALLALILTCLHSIFIVDQLPFSNVLTSITREFVYDYMKAAVFVISILTMFAYIFRVLLSDQKEFETMSNSMLSIALWQVGAFNQEIFFKVETFRTFFRITFMAYVITFGVLIVAFIKAPSITKEASLLYKEIEKINLILDIDVCFPWLRKVCEGNKSEINIEQRIRTKLSQLGLRRLCEETENKEEGKNHSFDLLLKRLDGMSHDIKEMQSCMKEMQSCMKEMQSCLDGITEKKTWRPR